MLSNCSVKSSCHKRLLKERIGQTNNWADNSNTTQFVPNKHIKPVSGSRCNWICSSFIFWFKICLLDTFCPPQHTLHSMNAKEFWLRRLCLLAHFYSLAWHDVGNIDQVTYLLVGGTLQLLQGKNWKLNLCLVEKMCSSNSKWMRPSGLIWKVELYINYWRHPYSTRSPCCARDIDTLSEYSMCQFFPT